MGGLTKVCGWVHIGGWVGWLTFMDGWVHMGGLIDINEWVHTGGLTSTNGLTWVREH